MQLMKVFTSDHGLLEVEYDLGIYPEEEQSFQGLIDHLTTAFIPVWWDRKFPHWRLLQLHQKPKEWEDAFANVLQILVRKIIVRKPEFCFQYNKALKHQYTHNLKDQYFGAIVRNYLLTSLKAQSFTQIWGKLALAVWKICEKRH